MPENFFEDPSPFFGPSRPFVAPVAPIVPTPSASAETGTKIWTYVLIAIIVVAIIVFNVYFYTNITQRQERKQ